MKTGNYRITPFQLFSVLYLGRFFANMTYIVIGSGSLSSSEVPVMVLFAFVLLLICTVPTAIFLKTDTGTGIAVRSECISPVFGKAVCFVLFLIFLFYAVITASRFEIFAGSVMFPRSDLRWFTVFVLAACGYIAYRGIEAIGRSSVIFLVLVVSSVVFVFCTLFAKFDFLNFPQLTSDGVISAAETSLFSAARTAEICTLPVVTPFVKGKLVKPMYAWLTAVGVTLTVIAVMISGVLGDFGYSQMFATYSLAVLARFGVIQRFDTVISAVWILCFIAKMSYFLFVCSHLLSSFIPEKRKAFPFITAAAVFAGMMYLSSSVESFTQTVASGVVLAVFAAGGIIIPSAVLVGERFVSKRKKGEAHE